MSRQELEALFLQNLPVVEKVVGALTRRYALSHDDSADFGAWAKLRLVENDYAVIGKFRGESSFSTFLTVVLAMLFREYRVQQWGRWRPSAAARRVGPIGIRLETLVIRDGLSLVEAAQMLRTAGETQLTDRELGAMVASFPNRPPSRRPQRDDSLTLIEGPDRADHRIIEAELAASSTATRRALDDALQTLPEDERLLVRLHYLEDMSIADIARGLALPQKPLYGRLKRAITKLRAALERSGVSHDEIRELAADV